VGGVAEAGHLNMYDLERLPAAADRPLPSAAAVEQCRDIGRRRDAGRNQRPPPCPRSEPGEHQVAWEQQSQQVSSGLQLQVLPPHRQQQQLADAAPITTVQNQQQQQQQQQRLPEQQSAPGVAPVPAEEALLQRYAPLVGYGGGGPGCQGAVHVLRWQRAPWRTDAHRGCSHCWPAPLRLSLCSQLRRPCRGVHQQRSLIFRG
jgi:hypothetical protein